MSTLVVTHLGRILTHADLYSVPADSVTHQVCRPQEVEIREVSNDARKLWKIGFCFVGLTLETGRA